MVTRWRFAAFLPKAEINVTPVCGLVPDSPPDCRIFSSNLHGIKNDVLRTSFFYGDPLEIRTPDTLLKRQVLYLLS